MRIPRRHQDSVGRERDAQDAWLAKTIEMYQHVRPTPYTGPITRHLLFHLWPVAANDRWRWNLDRLKERLPVFNGRRIVAIAEGPTTVPAQEAIDYLDGECDTLVVQNDPQLREVVSMTRLLERVETLDPNQITFYAHGKGVTHSHADSICHRWAEVMWDVCFADVAHVENLLVDYGMAGPFRRLGSFATPMNHRWHYSGTFYWFRNCFLFGRNWRRIDQQFFGTESYPGSHFLPDEGACLFMDEAGDLYDEWYWAQRVWPEYERWKSSTERSTRASW